MSTVVSQTLSPDGQWQTTVYDDGSSTVAAAPGTPLATALANQATLLQRAQTALTNNATYLGLASPSTAQNTAQVKALTRQIDALIKLFVTQDFSDITGT